MKIELFMRRIDYLILVIFITQIIQPSYQQKHKKVVIIHTFDYRGVFNVHLLAIARVAVLFVLCV